MPSPETSRVTNPASPRLPSWLVVLLMLGLVGLALWQNNHAAQTGTFATNSADDSVPDDKSPTEPELTPEASDAPGAEQAVGDTEKGHDSSSDSAKTATSGAGKLPQTLRSVDPKASPDARMNPQTRKDQLRGQGPLSGMRTKPSSGTTSSGGKPAEVDRNRPSEKSDGQSKGDPNSKTDKSSYQIENQTIRDLSGRVVYKGTIDLKPTLDRIERGDANSHRNDGTSFQNREGRLPRKPAGYYKEYVHPTKGEYGPGPQRVILGKEGEIWYTPDHYKSFKKIK